MTTILDHPARRCCTGHRARADAGGRAALRQRLRELAHDPDGIDRRLAQLRGEWDLDRALKVQFVAASLVGAVGKRTGRGGLRALALVMTGMRLQYLLRGWCPLATIEHRLGLRTRDEINLEYHLLRVLRGDWDPRFSGRYRSPAERLPLVLGALADDDG